MSSNSHLHSTTSLQTPCQQALSNDSIHDSIHDLLTTLLSPNPSLATSLHTLASHLRTTPSSSSRLLHLHAIPLLINLMVLHPSLPDLQSNICDILSTLAQTHSDARLQIFSHQGLGPILSALDLFPTHLNLQRNAFATLRALVLLEPARKAMLTTPILPKLKAVLSNPLENDEQLVYHAVGTTARILFESNDTRRRLGELGMVEVVAAIMKQFTDLPAVVAESGLAMRNLVFGCVENQKRMNDAGVLAVLFENLETHCAELAVVDQISAAVGNMLVTDEPARKNLLLECGYIRSLFRGLRVFSGSNVVCCQLGAILIHLCEHDPLGDHASANIVASVCVSEGVNGVDAIVATLDKAVQADDVKLFVKMTRLATWLCNSMRFRNDIGEARVFGMFLEFLKGQGRDEEQMDAVLNCVASCLSGMDKNKMLFTELNGLATVLQVMSHWSQRSETNEACVKLLDIAVAGQNVGAKDLVNCKADTTCGVLGAMSNFRGVAKIQEYGCSCLVKIAAEDGEETSRMVQLGAHSLVESVLSTHSGKPAVTSAASQLQMLLGEKSTRQGRSTVTGSGGTSVSRRMSRSRCVGDRGDRARSRNTKSKSPNRNARALEAGRRAVQRASMVQRGIVLEGEQSGAGGEKGFGAFSGLGGGGRKVDRNPRKKLSLETICE